MTAYIICAVLVTVGLFFLTDARPRDVTRELKKPFENEVNRNLRTVRTDSARCSGG